MKNTINNLNESIYTLDPSKVTDIIKNVLGDQKSFIIMTGSKGKWDLETELQIDSCTTKEQLIVFYRDNRNKLYYKDSELERIKQNKIIKLLIYLKVIKL